MKTGLSPARIGIWMIWSYQKIWISSIRTWSSPSVSSHMANKTSMASSGMSPWPKLLNHLWSTQLNFGTLNYPDVLFVFGTWWMIVGEINIFVGGLGDYPSGQLNVVNLGSEHTHVCLMKSTQFSLLSPGPLKFFLLWSCFAPNKLMLVELGNPVTGGPQKTSPEWVGWMVPKPLRWSSWLWSRDQQTWWETDDLSKYHVSWLAPGVQIPAFDSSNPRIFACIPIMYSIVSLWYSIVSHYYIPMIYNFTWSNSIPVCSNPSILNPSMSNPTIYLSIYLSI